VCRLAFSLILLSGISSLFAEPLTLDQAVRELAARNPELRAGEESVRAAEARRQAALGDYFPQVSASAGAARAGTRNLFGDRGTDAYSVGLDLRQNLFDGLRTTAGVDQRAAQAEAARASLDDLKARLSYDLQVAFADLLYAQENLRLSEAILKRRGDNLDLVELRYEGGREHKGSFLRIKAGRRQAAFDVERAGRDIRLAQTALARALGRDLFDAVVATGPFRRGDPYEKKDLALLAQQTPSVRRARADQRAAQAGEALARGDFLPSLDATLSETWLDDHWLPQGRAWHGGLSLSLPLFTGGRSYRGWRAAQADRRRAEFLANDAYTRAVVDLTSAWTEFKNAEEEVEVQKEFVEAAEIRATIARSQYTSGLLQFEDWDIIENDLINNHNKWLADRRDAARSQAAWERAQGLVLRPDN
jgi:outer membrane protein TolC